MNLQLTLFRAIGSEFARRKFTSLILLFGSIAGVVLALMLLLVNVNIWWWLLAAPVMLIIIVGIAAALLAWAIIVKIRPKITKMQSRAVAGFVDKLERVTEGLQTPMPFIILRIIIDLVWKRDTPFIQQLTKDSTTLHNDFEQLVKDFKQ